MKITASQLSFNTERKYEEQRVSTRAVEILEDRISLSPKKSKATEKPETISVKLNIGKHPQLFAGITELPAPDPEDQINGDPKLAAMKRMIESMTGRKIKLTDISGFSQDASSSAPSSFPFSSPASSGISGNTSQSTSNSFIKTNTENMLSRLHSRSGKISRPGEMTRPDEMPEIPVQRVRITEFNSLYESEATNFKARGVVRNAAGEDISFSLNLDMKREFYAEEQIQITGDAILTDPLVVNFGGTPADLTDVRFKFDLNSDGEEEEIPWLAAGSGFLVLDRNRDGVVNNGSELFGPQTNNGFNELAKLDEDGNGWIDENDSAFEKLSVWSGESPETAELKSIKESGIGAIAVSSADTLFSLKDRNNETLGQIRRTGIYLEEDGKVQTIQQLDLSV